MLAGASPRWKAQSRQSSLEEELEEAPRKAHERGSLPARASALRRSTSAEPGTARTAPLPGVQECFLNADAVPFNCTFLMHLSCPGRAVGDPGEVCILGRVNV